MAKTVNTGWRNVTPGACMVCGSDGDWECDGRGMVFCSCERCPECGEEPGWHAPGCQSMTEDEWLHMRGPSVND